MYTNVQCGETKTTINKTKKQINQLTCHAQIKLRKKS